MIGIASGQTFKIRNGIPVILDRSQRRLRNLFNQLFYDLTAPLYDGVVDLGASLKINAEEIVRKEYIAKLPVRPGNKVLETAAGTASNILKLPANAEYFALDIAYRMLVRAKKKLSAARREAEFVQADGAFIPFRDNTFDVVFQMGGLQFFSNPFKGVSEMARVAKPGTQVFILDEISGAIRTLQRLPAHKQYSTREKALAGMKRLVPASMQSVNCEIIPNTDYYSLTFSKPDYPTILTGFSS